MKELAEIVGRALLRCTVIGFTIFAMSSVPDENSGQRLDIFFAGLATLAVLHLLID